MKYQPVALQGWGAAAFFVLLLWVCALPAAAVIPDNDAAFLSAPTPNPDGFTASLRPVLIVMVLGIVLLGSLYTAYRKRRIESDSSIIRVLASSPVAQGVILQVIDVGGNIFVVAISRNGPTTIGQITDPEKINEIKLRSSQENSLSLHIPPVPFQKALERLFKPNPAAQSSKTPADPKDPKKPRVREALLDESIDRVRRLNPGHKEQL